MGLERKRCLMCDDLAVIEVMSVQLQAAPLCGVHWADYCMGPQSPTSEEVQKYFADGKADDRLEPLPVTIARIDLKLQTDETRGIYKTEEEETG
jgi:nucleotidyltransferase/DNA polymerase involved in DNA repair